MAYMKETCLGLSMITANKIIVIVLFCLIIINGQFFILQIYKLIKEKS